MWATFHQNHPMRSRWAVPVLVFALALSACGDDGGSDAATDETSTTSTAPNAPSDPIATPQALARLAAQLDGNLRGTVQAADPCLHGPREQCTGPALDAYTQIDEMADAVVTILKQSTTKGDMLYVGEPPAELVGRLDDTISWSTETKALSKSAQEACVPSPGPECDDATAALNDALIELYKVMNAWRADL